MMNLVNFETNERFNNFPYSVEVSRCGVCPDFYPDFQCDTFMSFSRLEVPFNDDFVLGDSLDFFVSAHVYKKLLLHYNLNFVSGS